MKPRRLLLTAALSTIAVVVWASWATGAAPLAGRSVGGPHGGTVDGLDEVSYGAAHAALPQAPAYEGGRTGCRRCHLREYRSWQRTPHADALDSLSEEEQQNPECLRCHTTGYGIDSGFLNAADTPNLAGVTCEQCHGPGSVYKDEETMKSRDASVAAGLLLPDEQTCLACHNADSPTFPGEFNYQERVEVGVHEIQSGQ